MYICTETHDLCIFHIGSRKIKGSFSDAADTFYFNICPVFVVMEHCLLMKIIKDIIYLTVNEFTTSEYVFFCPVVQHLEGGREVN